MEKMNLETPNMTKKNIKKIGELFPNCITETMGDDGKMKETINFNLLKQMLSGEVLEGDEAYEFSWVGKKAAIVEANKPIRKTLRPCPEESVDWDKTGNLYIEGDNLEVLKLLQESYLGKIKMIYIDPPYNTGNDFIYNDDFKMADQEYADESGELDEFGNRLFRNTNSNGRFHSDWCSMVYSRLMLARNLLNEDGVLFISIDDNEQANLKKICDEIYGESNFVGELIHQRAKGGGQAKHIVKGHDYILVYAKNINNVSLTRKKVIQQKTYEINGELYIKNDDIIRKQFGKYDKSLGDRRCFYEQLVEYKGEEKKKEIDDLIKRGDLFLELNKEGMHTICKYEKVNDATSKLYSIIKVLSEEGKKELDDLGIIGFSYPKPVEVLRQLVEAGATSRDSIVLDFFSGSATTAHAVMQLNAEDGGNRKFIMVQLPEKCDDNSEAYKAGYKNICEIGKERIRRAGRFIKEKQGVLANDLDVGFRVFKLDESNMNDVYYSAGDYNQGMLESLESNVKADRTDLDLLFGCLLEWGLPLSMPYKSEKIENCTIHTYNDGDLIACFDENVPDYVIKEVAKRKPLRAVFRDSSFEGSPAKINVGEIFKMLAPETRVKVI